MDFLLSLIPFTTALVGKDINNSLSMFIYVFVSYMWMISFQLLSFQALRDNPDNRDKIYISWGYVAKISIVNIVALIFAIIVPPFSFVVMVILIIYLAVNLFKDWNND